MPKLLAWVSRLQKTSSPTFQVPSCKTEDPLALLSTVCPTAVRSYFTVALVEESIVTESTLVETPDAGGLDENEPIADAKAEPFCSNWTRLLLGVFGLKNVSQSAVIWATAFGEPPVAAVPVDVGVAAPVDGAEAEGLGFEVEEELEQADITVMSTRPSAGAR